MIKFIIDTDSYSGNFEREMCAFSTGHSGEYGMGRQNTEETIKQQFAPYIASVKDDRDCMTPVNIAITPGFGNNGYGFLGDGSADSYKRAKEAYINYKKENELDRAIKRVEFYKNTKADNSSNILELKRIETEIADLEKRPEDTFLPYPAYQSVCIYFKTLPENLEDILKKRCQEYADKSKIKILNFRIIDETTEQAIESNSNVVEGLKVKVTAYKDNIIIETLNYDESDKDFHPNTGSNIGCSLSNFNRLGISDEALLLLKEVKKCSDAIGDFMWDDISFSWIGGPISFKNIKKTVGSRSYKVGKNFESIPNQVSQDFIEKIEESEKIKEINYDDINHEIWIEIVDNYSRGEFTINTRFLDKYIYDDNCKIINAPEGLVVNKGDSILIKRIKENETTIKKIIDKIFANSSTISKEKHMDYINRFFEIGAWNNVMDPTPTYYRMAFNNTQKNLIETLEKF